MDKVKLSAALKMNVILRELNDGQFQGVLRSEHMEIVKKPPSFVWGDIVPKESTDVCIKVSHKA
jgi:hypothetical protein